MSLGKEKAYDVDASVSVSANGHDPSVCVYSSTTNDALNDELHERPWLEEMVLERLGTWMDSC